MSGRDPGRVLGQDGDSIIAAIIYLLFGPLVWAVHLLLVYGPQSAICARSQSFAAGEAALLAHWVVYSVTGVTFLTVVAAMAMPRLLARLLRFTRSDVARDRFAVSTMRLLAFLSAAGILWAGLTPILLDGCAQLR